MTAFAIPTEMTALVAEEPGRDGAGLRVKRIPVPAPRRGQVLVKMHAAPVNPADLMYLEGRYGIDRPFPATPGFEGSGVVVASGGGLLGKWMVGKRVAVGGHACSGTWAEYCITEANQCVPLAKGLTLDQGAAALANPITALALVDTVVRSGHRAYVQTAAAGQLGRMILVAARERGLEGIHVVRRVEQAASLRALGAEHVLVSTAPGFERDLAALAKKLGATCALEAVAGEMTGKLLNALPPESEVIVYGSLSAEACGAIDPMALAFGHKRVRGFEVAAYLEDRGLWRSIRLANAAQKRVGRGDFTTEVARRVSLADAAGELAGYASRMSDGKVLLMPELLPLAKPARATAA